MCYTNKLALPCLALPQSTPVEPGTAGPCYRLRRRRGQSGIQEPWGTELCQRPYVNKTQAEVALLDHKCGHRTTQSPCHNLRRSWHEVRCGTELFQNFRIVTTPRACPSVLLAWRTCSNAVALGGGSISTGHISLAGWDQTSTYRPGRGGTVCPAGWRQYKDTLASQLTAPPGGPP